MATNAIGTTLKFTPDGGSQTTVGRLTSIGAVAPDSDEIDVTTLDAANGYRQYIQGARNAGTVEIEGFFDSSNAGQTALRTAYANGKVGTVLITFPDSTAVTFSAFVKSYHTGAAEVDGAIGFGAVLRITGGITIS